jgi:hypothetical protein
MGSSWPFQFGSLASVRDVSMDMAGVDLLTIHSGKIAEVRLFSEDGPAEDRFWGHP